MPPTDEFEQRDAEVVSEGEGDLGEQMKADLAEAGVDDTSVGGPPAEAVSDSEEGAGGEVSSEAPVTEEGGEEWKSIREAASGFGLDLSSHEDDASALRDLVERARAAEQNQQLAAQYQQMAQMAAQQLQGSVQAEERVEEDEEVRWRGPDFDPSWMHTVSTDESGNYIPINGGTQESVEAFKGYVAHRAQEMQKFQNNPYEYMRPFIEHVAKGMVSENQGQLKAELDESTQARDFLNRNASWIFKGAEGGEGVGLDGQRELSEDGRVFNDSIRAAAAAGLNTEQQKDWALRDVEMSRMKRQLAELQGQNSAETSKREQLQKAAGFDPTATPPAVQAAVTQAEGTDPPANASSLQDQLRSAMKARGVTDEVIANSY